MTKLDFIKDNVDNIFKCQQEIRDIFQDSYTDFNKINNAEQRISELNGIIDISCRSIEDALNAEYYHHLPRKFIIFKKYFKVFMMSSIILIECPQDPNNLDWAFCVAQIREYLRHDDFDYTVFDTYGCTHNFCIKNQPKGVYEGKSKEKIE